MFLILRYLLEFKLKMKPTLRQWQKSWIALVPTYVPESCLLEIGEVCKITRVIYGDLLTVACIRGAVTLCSSEIVEEKKLNGLTEVMSDWHTQLCLVTVCM